MFGHKLILICLILLEFAVEKCSVHHLTVNDTNSSKLGKSLNSSVVANTVNDSSVQSTSASPKTVHLKRNQTSRLREEDESDDNEDYPDNEGIDGQSEDGLDDEGAEQEEGNLIN